MLKESLKMKTTTFFNLLVVCLISAGCGGGGGGGANTFDGPSIVRPSYNDLTNLPSPVGLDIGSVTSFNNSTENYPETTLTPQIFASDASMTLVIPELGVNDIYTAADVVSTGVIGNTTIPVVDAVKTSGTVTREWVYIQPTVSSSLRYSTLGIWVQTDSSTSATDTAFISAGSKTVGSDIPTAGMASYTGAILGFATEGIGANYTIKAPAFAVADFGARSVTLNSALSIKTSHATLETTFDNNYNLSGTLTYSAGNNALSGTISTVGKTGSATGVFYGPQAAEIGGTFRVSDPGGTGMFAGGFGLKQ
jgi:hypothetical protein